MEKNTNSYPKLHKSKISVIIPCYNVEQWIDRCLTTITNQTYGIENMEIICIDDFSTDNTLEKLMNWESLFPENIIVIPLKENGRQGHARNVGLSYSSGEWIAFIDSDDWVELDYLEKMYNCINPGKTQVVQCRSYRDSSADSDPVFLPFDSRLTDKASREIIVEESKRELFIFLELVTYAAWGKLINREFLLANNLFFYEGVTYEDAAWGCFMLIYTSNLYILEEKLYHYFVNNNSTVLCNNSEHHLDLLIVQERKWDELKSLGFTELYKDALIFEHTMSYYLSFLKVLALRYTNPSYDLFLTCKNKFNSEIPDCRNNKYVKEGFKEFHKSLLDTLYFPISENSFRKVIEAIRAHGGL